MSRALPGTVSAEMSLRAFHLLFIALSVMLAAFFAAWCGREFQARHETVYAISAVLALATAGGLATYGISFQKKTRGL